MTKKVYLAAFLTGSTLLLIGYLFTVERFQPTLFSTRDGVLFLLEYLKSLADSWPFVVLILVVLFRKKLQSLLQFLIVEHTDKGFKFRFNLQQMQDVMGGKNKKDQEKRDREQGELNKKLGTAESRAVNAESRADDLYSLAKKMLADLDNANKELTFERIYNVIFGSQIKLLEYLAVVKQEYQAGPLQKFYYHDLYVKSGGGLDYTFEKYMGYLKSRGLITFDSLGENGLVKIDKKGSEFIAYLDKGKHSKNKPL